jgi:hypothetical protein
MKQFRNGIKGNVHEFAVTVSPETSCRAEGASLEIADV